MVPNNQSSECYSSVTIFSEHEVMRLTSPFGKLTLGRLRLINPQISLVGQTLIPYCCLTRKSTNEEIFCDFSGSPSNRSAVQYHWSQSAGDNAIRPACRVRKCRRQNS